MILVCLARSSAEFTGDDIFDAVKKAATNNDLIATCDGGIMLYTDVSILTSYGENQHYVKLPIFSEFMENSTKFMKNSDLTKWTQNLR